VFAVFGRHVILLTLRAMSMYAGLTLILLVVLSVRRWFCLVDVSGVDDMFEDEQPQDLKESVPVLEHGWASFGDYQLVGNGEVTNEFCGKYIGLKGCPRVDLHDKITLDGVNYAGKVFVRKVHHWCCKPSCPTCFKSGWAVREAGRIRDRLVEASKRFGAIEHLMISLPMEDYGLDLKAMRLKAIKLLKARGVIGGVLIFHGFRYNLRKQWYWSVHFHVLGFILGGYAKCRNCARKWNCLRGCGGFDDRNNQMREKDGYVVKVFGKRITVFGTAWYQLNHATIKRGVKRFHVATWFGVCSYRKLKVTVELRKAVCPICQHDLVKLRYFGDKRLVTDRTSFEYERDSFEDFEEDGRVVWFESVKRGSGSYEA